METSAAQQESVSDELKKSTRLTLEASEVEESIRYAGNLQRSILPNEQVFKGIFYDAFVYFQPKDIVSGDFYWIYQHKSDIYFAVGDCTGHGVPGAMINIAGNSLLRQIIKQEGFSEPSEIIQQLDAELIELFNVNLTDGQTQDGMDIIFCKFNLERMIGEFCPAGRPLVMIRDGELTEFKKGIDAVGLNFCEQKDFRTESIQLKAGDQFFLFSDGYTDQFGGEKIKKFNRKRFRKLLTSLTEMKGSKQKEELHLNLQNWMGQHQQIDDVCVLGIQL